MHHIYLDSLKVMKDIHDIYSPPPFMSDVHHHAPNAALALYGK